MKFETKFTKGYFQFKREKVKVTVFDPTTTYFLNEHFGLNGWIFV